MKQAFWVLLLAFILSACQGAPNVLSWVSPAQKSTLTGTVKLSVEAQGTYADTVKDVVFYADDKELGRASPEDGTFTLTWDTARLEPGEYHLRAVPYGGRGVTQVVTVLRGGSSNVVTTPSDPSSGGGGEASSSDDPLNLGGIVDLWPGGAETPAAEAVLNMPPGFPWGSLYPAEALRAQLRAALMPTQTETIRLPRGIYSYNEDLETWEVSPSDEGGIQISFSYPDPETGENHDIQINVVWDKYAPTVVVTGPNGDVEMPRGAWLFVQDNEEDILELDIEVAWYTPDGCNGPTLFPETLALTGWINSPRPDAGSDPTVAPAQEGDPAEAPESELEATDLLLEMALEDRAGGGKTLTTELAMSALTDKGFEVVAGWTAELAGDVEFDDCFVSGARVDTVGLFTEVKIGPETGPYRGSNLTLNLFGLEYDGDGVPVAGELEGELVAFDEEAALEEITTAEAVLGFNDQDGFTVEGDVTLPDGSTMDVVEYVQMILDVYTQRALEGSQGGG